MTPAELEQVEGRLRALGIPWELGRASGLPFVRLRDVRAGMLPVGFQPRAAGHAGEEWIVVLRDQGAGR